MALARKVVAEVRSLRRSTLDRLDSVFAIPAGTIEVFVEHLGGGAPNDVTTKRGLSPALMTSALSTTRQGGAQDLAA